MSETESDLFQPAALGPIELRNRVVMAPLTRSRAGAGEVPRPLNAEYYAQRATAGLIIAEAAQISQQGQGYAYTPGIFTDAQVEGWRGVTQAVHDAGGRIFCQLWHVGRVSHPDLQPGTGCRWRRRRSRRSARRSRRRDSRIS
jgi:N-ethylmaleimide reductase